MHDDIKCREAVVFHAGIVGLRTGDESLKTLLSATSLPSAIMRSAYSIVPATA
jgi:hypothetical protein